MAYENTIRGDGTVELEVDPKDLGYIASLMLTPIAVNVLGVELKDEDHA